MVQSSYLKGNTTKPNTNEEQLNDIFCEAVSFDTSKNDCPISLNVFIFITLMSYYLLLLERVSTLLTMMNMRLKKIEFFS